jgi:arabinose-5-phosphate isomerase
MHMDITQMGKEIIRAQGRTLEQVAEQLDANFAKAVELLAACKGHVIASGVGTTGTIARRFAHLLCNVGCPALFLHAGDSLHGSSGAVKAEDVLVLLSKTGETRETCELAEIVGERGTPVITLTAVPDSTIGRLSTLIIQVKTPPDVDPYSGLMAVGSSLAMSSVCDALVFGVLEVKGTPREHFVRGHPGGIIHALTEKES